MVEIATHALMVFVTIITILGSYGINFRSFFEDFYGFNKLVAIRLAFIFSLVLYSIIYIIIFLIRSKVILKVFRIILLFSLGVLTGYFAKNQKIEQKFNHQLRNKKYHGYWICHDLKDSLHQGLLSLSLDKDSVTAVYFNPDYQINALVGIFKDSLCSGGWENINQRSSGEFKFHFTPDYNFQGRFWNSNFESEWEGFWTNDFFEIKKVLNDVISSNLKKGKINRKDTDSNSDNENNKRTDDEIIQEIIKQTSFM